MPIILEESRSAAQKNDLMYPKANLNHGSPKVLSPKRDMTQYLVSTYSVFAEKSIRQYIYIVLIHSIYSLGQLEPKEGPEH